MSEARFSEIVGHPPHGRVFQQEVRAGFADCAPSGRARLDGLARLLQDVAYADVVDAGLADSAVWVVRRTRLRIHRFPRFGERLRALTFCSGLGTMWAERRTTIVLEEGGEAVGFNGSGSSEGEAGPDRGGEPEVEAVALWVHLDPETWRPSPFQPREIELYGEPAGGRRIRARLHHPAPGGEESCRSWTFRATECDIAGHVNNAAYWTPLEEELLAAAEPGPLDAEIEFRTPAQPGEKRVLARDEMRWITAGDGEIHASVRMRLG